MLSKTFFCYLVECRFAGKSRSMSSESAPQTIVTMGKVTHVIFDMDGLLLDTEPIYDSVMGEIAKSYNKDYLDEIKLKILGRTDQMFAKILVEDLNLPITEEELLVKFYELCRQRFSNVSLLKGAERLIKHLNQHNIPFCLATSASQEIAEIKMKSHQNLFDLFSHKVMGSTDPEVKRGKPDPDIFLIAARRFVDNPKPVDCLVFEDAPNGVKAAVSAGMQVVMVPDPIITEDQRTGATLVLKSLEDFQPEVFGLPPFN